MEIGAVDGHFFVELVVAKADFAVVFDGATVKNIVNICPHEGGEAHGARFARGINVATGEVVCAERFGGVRDGDHFAVAQRIFFMQHHVVAARDNSLLTVRVLFDNDRPKRPAMPRGKSARCLLDCLRHKNVHVCIVSYIQGKVKMGVVVIYIEHSKAVSLLRVPRGTV